MHVAKAAGQITHAHMRDTFPLTEGIAGRFFASRSEALTKAFPLTPRDTEVPGA